jgi:hypothetical protein
VRQLYVVPIIHTSADMGSLAPGLDQASAAALGTEEWEDYKETVSRFWEAVGDFFDRLSVSGFKLYQDGLVAEGEEGLRIVREGKRKGSKNFEILCKLVSRGAVLVKTEDVGLVRQERAQISRVLGARSARDKQVAGGRYKRIQGKLLARRDDFVAKRIQQTLYEHEAGILFVGAYHDVLARLPADIRVSQIKEVAKVRQYHRAVAGESMGREARRKLSQYLASPVNELSF